MVERNLAKVEVAGPSPVFRSGLLRKEEKERVKNLMYQRYVRFFRFLGDVFERIKKQVARTEIVTCFARTENRSRFTINALNYIVLRPIISMLHTFNRSNPSSIMKRTTFSVVFFCKKTKLTKKGTAPIYARITTSGRSTEIYTQCRIEPEHWNQRLERCMLRDPVSTQINGILATYRTNILAAYG